MPMTDKPKHLTTAPDVLTMLGKIAGGLANMSVGLRQAKHDDVSSLDLYFNGSAEQGIALTYFRWPFPLAKVEGATGQTKLSLKGDGSFTYLPAKDFTGTVTFTYQAKNSKGKSSSATATISAVR